MGSIPRARPFLYLDPPAATSACLSDARLCSLISARGTGVLGNPLLRLGLPRRFDSLLTRVAPSALAKKVDWGSPQRPRIGRRMGGIALCHTVATAMPVPQPCSRWPSTSRRARALSPRWPCSCAPRARAWNPASGPASSRPCSHVFSLTGQGIGPWRGPSSMGWR